MRRRTFVKLLVARWGFAAMVAVAISAGIAAGATAAMPADVPSFALRAVPVYRVEVGAAVFLGFYLAAMALVPAMHNRGFTELGTGGIRRGTWRQWRAPHWRNSSSRTWKRSTKFRHGERSRNMSTERRFATPEEIRARRERMDYLAEKVRASLARKKVKIARLRAEGRLPPDEGPPSRF